MMPVIRPEPVQDIGELARQLLAIAAAEGLEQPVTDTSGPVMGFLVSDELFASYRGAPSPNRIEELFVESDPEEEPDSGDGGESDGSQVRRGRKKKGSN